MRVFVDANILVSVLNKEYPLFPFTSRIMSLADHPQFEIFTSPLCLAIAFYFAKKTSYYKGKTKDFDSLRAFIYRGKYTGICFEYPCK